MLPWIIAAALYVIGALGMAVSLSEHPNFGSRKSVLVCALWPLATIYGLAAAAFDRI